MKLAIGSDHAGYLLKENIKEHLNENEIEFTILVHSKKFLQTIRNMPTRQQTLL